jgi:hypothetical protein
MIYAVECVHCQETLLTTAQIGDAEARIRRRPSGDPASRSARRGG